VLIEGIVVRFLALCIEIKAVVACLKNIAILIEVVFVRLKILHILIEAIVACFKIPHILFYLLFYIKVGLSFFLYGKYSEN
jgi:hypothetical protein